MMLRLLGNIKRSEGLSLIEVVIAMAIGLIGTLGSYALLANVHCTSVENRELLEAQQEARNIMERMTRELRESSPEVTWTYEGSVEGEGSYVYFYTPRNSKKEFILNSEGEPAWQRSISYWLDKYSHTLYRFQYYMTPPDGIDNWYDFDIISENVENVSFSRVNDMITISLRTFSENPDGLGTVAPSYTDIETTVKLRN